MSYETISVRMNRSDPSIRWGFTLRQQGAKLVVAMVENESLSDKAGMKPNDEVDAVCGRDAKHMGVNEANSIIDRSHQEVHLNLRRYVTSHTCLPWTLTEQDNKLIVDEVRPGYGSGFGTGHGFDNHAIKQSSQYNAAWDSSMDQRSQYNSTWDRSGQQRSIPIQYGTSNQSDKYSHSTNRTSHHGSYVATNTQPRFYQSPSVYSSRHGHSTYGRHETNAAPQGNGYGPSYSIHSKTNYESGSQSNNMHYGSGGGGTDSGYSSTAKPTYTTNFGSERHSTVDHATPAAQNYSYNNGMTKMAYKPTTGGTPLNQAAFIQTSLHSPSLQSSYLSPGGTRVYYHSPSPRTRRELAPNASIQYLQYHSPETTYPAESVAEHYSQQTERPTELSTSFRSQSPAYLTSEAKKMIEEQAHGRDHKIASPSAQSSSFKRISQAVGEPVK